MKEKLEQRREVDSEKKHGHAWKFTDDIALLSESGKKLIMVLEEIEYIHQQG